MKAFFSFLKTSFQSLTAFEWALWLGSLAAIALSFFCTHNTDYLTLAASLLGATSLIFVAKGNVLGQFIVIVFGILYAIISYSYAYYGEMITYVGMTLPSAAVSIIVWLKNSFRGNHAEIKITTPKKREYPIYFAVAAAVTVAFYFILRALGTSNLLVSTLSVFTSFFAVQLIIRRSPFYALAYACNDIVLIVLWILATIENLSYLPVIVCFFVFLVNDLYGFFNWTAIRRRQNAETKNEPTEEQEKA